MSFYPELDDLPLADLKVRFDGPVPDNEVSYEDTYYGEVALKVAEAGLEGVEFLWSRRHLEDEPRVRAVIFALTDDSPPKEREFDEFLLVSLSDPRPGVVAEAIDGLRRRNIQEAREQVLGLADHPSPLVRGSVLRYARAIDPEGSRKFLLEGLRDPDPIVRQNAVDELAELGDPNAIPLLRPLLRDSDRDVRQATRSALLELEPSE